MTTVAARPPRPTPTVPDRHPRGENLMMNPAFLTTAMSMDAVRKESPNIWVAAIDHAHGGELLPEAVPLLERFGILQQGVMHDVTAEAIRHFHPRENR